MIEAGDMEQDAKVKRAIFIDGCHDLLEEFSKTNPEVQTKLTSLYHSSCYGSNTWNLYGEWPRKLLTSWNVNLKLIWQLPHETHRYFFEHLTECRHLKILLIKRFLKFVSSIIEGNKSSCKLLLRTICGNSNSTTGKNIRNIEIEAGMRLEVESLNVKIKTACKKIQFAVIEEDQMWRIGAVKELSQIKSSHLHLEGFTSEEVQTMLQFICVS